MHDVIVVGAGPAGSEAAYRLAKMGYDVLVLEKDKLNREKPCGGFIQRIELDEFGCPPEEIIERKIPQCVLFGKNSKAIISCNPSPITVMRSKYDCWLQNRAKDKGAEFLGNTAVGKVSLKSDPEVMLKSGSSLRTRLLIDASGSQSVVRRTLGLTWKKEDVAVAIQYHMELTQSEITERFGNRCEFYFGSLNAPEGYYWVFPKKEKVAVGMGGSALLIKSSRINLKEQLDLFRTHHPIASSRLKDAKVKFLQSAMLPVKISKTLVYKNSLVIGDAGGFANPLHKAGIFPARKSAEIASKYAKAFLESGKSELLYGYALEAQTRFYDQNYKWDKLLLNLFHDDRIIDRLIHLANEKQSMHDSLNGLLNFFSHKNAYYSIRNEVA